MTKQVMEQALEALEESHALNVNWVSVAEPEQLEHLSEYRAVIKMGEAAIAALKEAIKQAGEPVAWLVSYECVVSVSQVGYGKPVEQWACTHFVTESIAEAEAFDCLSDDMGEVIGDIRNKKIVPIYASTPTIPKGWRLVPEEPTAHMEAVGYAARMRPSDMQKTGTAVYKAMLAAAPSYQGDKP